MGLYKVILPFTRNGKKYGFGDTVELPDTEGEEIRDVGMLMNYGIIDMPKKSDSEEKK
jgi:hypothetical protein